MVRGLFGGGAEDLVYFEKQGPGRLCGYHCLNNLLQGPVFDVDEVSRVGRELDAQERRLVQRADPNYTNVSADGFFSVTVIDTCLARQGFRMLPFGNPNFKDIHLAPAKHGDAFICNQREHWFAIRLVKGRWFTINSLQAAPEAIAESALSSFLDTLKTSEWSVFVVRPLKWPAEKMPDPTPSAFPRVRVLTSVSGPLTDPAFLSFDVADRLSKSAGDEAVPLSGGGGGGLPLEQNTQRNEGYTWPTEGGRTLGEGQRTTTTNSNMAMNEDPELQSVLMSSAILFREELPNPPPEKQDGGVGIRVIDPTGVTLTRHFSPDNTIRDVFLWVHKDERFMANQLPLLATLDPIILQSAFPRRQFVRRLGQQGFMVGVGSEDLTLSKIGSLFSTGETLRLSIPP